MLVYSFQKHPKRNLKSFILINRKSTQKHLNFQNPKFVGEGSPVPKCNFIADGAPFASNLKDEPACAPPGSFRNTVMTQCHMVTKNGVQSTWVQVIIERGPATVSAPQVRSLCTPPSSYCTVVSPPCLPPLLAR